MAEQDLIKQLKSLLNKIKKTQKLLKIQDKKTELKVLEIEMSDAGFWQNQKNAKNVARAANDLREEIEKWAVIKKEVDDLLELALSDGNGEFREQLKIEAKKKEKKFSELEFYTLLSGKYDECGAIISIHSGTGGVDAQDWTEILLRMYLRFCDKKNWDADIIDKIQGNDAGIKSATVRIKGRYAFGYLKSETGVHRLVRISPFDAEAMRHTSFALIEVLPEIQKKNELKIKNDDLRIDTFKASGHGGQGVNTTDSAVRIFHKPTKTTVVCRNERSQLQNKETAMKILQAKLIALQEEKGEKERQKARGEIKRAEWGAQIRSYVMQPYKMVKDHRTKCETQEIDNVLDGEIDEFIEEYLKYLKQK
ncbi:peptide chain release factor 2 [Candidatus Parcubacteria bacterium]|nr:peptide chain release factor 2 [Candidatus Parcubacteria bacterium]